MGSRRTPCDGRILRSRRGFNYRAARNLRARGSLILVPTIRLRLPGGPDNLLSGWPQATGGHRRFRRTHLLLHVLHVPSCLNPSSFRPSVIPSLKAAAPTPPHSASTSTPSTATTHPPGNPHTPCPAAPATPPPAAPAPRRPRQIQRQKQRLFIQPITPARLQIFNTRACNNRLRVRIETLTLLRDRSTRKNLGL